MSTADLLLAVARGEVSKSQLRDGRYVPATKLSPLGREKQRDALKNGSLGHLRGPSKGAPTGRGINALFDQAAVGQHIARAVKEPTRASTVHRNLHFGSSVSPELAAKIEQSVNPKLLSTPVAFHRGPAQLGIVAGGTGSHVTTGGMGRVVIGQDAVDADGRLAPFARDFKFGDVINHELVHATTRGKNPNRFLHYEGGINQKKALGEEARADGRGVRGQGLYQRNGLIQSRDTLREIDRQVASGELDHHPKDLQADYRDRLAGQHSYHSIHEKLQDLHHRPEPRSATPPPPRSGPSTPPWTPSQPAGRRGLPHLPRLRLTGANRTSLAGAAIGASIGAGVGLGLHVGANRQPRDADGDGFIYDGTPQQRRVSKSQRPDGSWTPLSQLDRKEREEQRRTARLSHHARHDPKTAALRNRVRELDRRLQYGSGRDIYAAYRQHGVQPGLPAAVAEKLRPSTRFGTKVRYGSSVTPGMEQAIEAGLNERVVRSSPVPLAFHYRDTVRQGVAAAAPGHVTTGGIGRILINPKVISPTGKFRVGSHATGSRISFIDMINHEATHAALKNKNPQRHLDADQLTRVRRNLGEEGRADAVAISGPGLYQRLGNVLDRKGLARAEKSEKWLPKKQRPDYRRSVDAHRHYITVHETVQRAYGTYVEPRDARGRWRLAGARRKTVSKRDRGALTQGAGAGLAGVGLGTAVAGNVASERLLMHPREDWAEHRKLARRARQVGLHGRRGLAVGATALAAGTADRVLEGHRRPRRTTAPDGHRLSV